MWKQLFCCLQGWGAYGKRNSLPKRKRRDQHINTYKTPCIVIIEVCMECRCTTENRGIAPAGALVLHPFMGHVSFENLIKFKYTLLRKIRIHSHTHVLHKISGDSQTLQSLPLGFVWDSMTLICSVREQTVLEWHLNWNLVCGFMGEGSLS